MFAATISRVTLPGRKVTGEYSAKILISFSQTSAAMHSGTMAADADFDPDTRPAHLTKGGSSRVDVPESASTATAGLSTDMHGRSDENLEWTADPDFVSGVGDAPRQSSSLLVDGRSKHAAPQDPSADMDWGSEHDIVPAALESPVPNEHLALVAASTGTALHDPDADMGLGATDSDMAMQEPAPDSTASPWASRLDREAALSLTHSAVDVVAQGVPLGFGVARACTGLGFAAASACLRTGAVCSAAAGGVGMAAALTGVDMAIGAAGKATLAGQSFAEDFTKYSLQAAKVILLILWLEFHFTTEDHEWWWWWWRVAGPVRHARHTVLNNEHKAALVP